MPHFLEIGGIMAILIGHASIDENGKSRGGKAGDQTKKEVCTRKWYNKGWDFVLRCKDKSRADRIAIACENACVNDNIGYDQNQRNALDKQASKVNYDLSKIKTPCGCDCSSLMAVCAWSAGIFVPYTKTGNAPTTSTMRHEFLSTGEFDILTDFKYLISDNYLKRGDILVKEGSHTVMALENGARATESKIGVDVSSYQGDIDWYLAKKSGIEFAILKVIRKDLNPDKQFENNWKGCTREGIPIQGVYNYSYATTVQKAETDARKVLEVLNGRKVMVWLDVEDNCQINLGTSLIAIIDAYKEVIESAGLKFGVYTGESFYNSYIKPYEKLNCLLWIARYGKNTGIMDLKYQPQVTGMIGWQYTSAGRVNGISGGVDMDVWYESVEHIPSSSLTYKNPYPEPGRLLYKKTPMMRGNDVKWVQAHLVDHKCLPSFNAKGKNNIDGVFGTNTDTAVRKFQKTSGITVDGKVGAVTKAYLKA